MHDWTICPFAHAGEKAVRRDPRLHSYTGIACPDMKKVGVRRSWLGMEAGVQEAGVSALQALQHPHGCCAHQIDSSSNLPACSPARLPLLLRPLPQTGACIRGEKCPYAHNVFEYWLHPTRYRTQLCNDGPMCRRGICFFAHRWEGAYFSGVVF